MKCLISLIGVILLAYSLVAQEKKPWHVDRLCGRTQYLKRIADRKNPNSYSDKRKSLQGVRLELYESNQETTCCNGLKVVGTTISGRSGAFEFEPYHPGRYWLLANWSGREYKVPVIYEPQKKSSTVCSDQGIQVEDDGDASWWVTVTVD